jgi:MoxR-like ATPase
MQQIFEKLRTELVSKFPERQSVIDGALCAILAAEHVLFIGPPGTAKSALVRAIAQAFGGVYFERLVTKFSTPEELFGPISLKALEQDRFTRITAGKLPGAEFAFIDEIFKCNSALLNSMLALVNEKVFHNDGQPVPVPLVSMFGASNELPEGKELEALFDRFILRFEVNYLLRPSHLKAVLTAPEPSVTTVLDMKTLKAAQAEVAKVKVTDATVDAIINIREALKQEGIVASDRRWKKSIKLAQAAAWLLGEKQTTPEDLPLLTDALWREPKERPKIAKTVGRVADPVATQATEILDAARETADKVHALKSGDRKQYIAQAANALEQFGQQMQKLEKLAASGGKRAREVIKEASGEITAMHEDLARTVSSGLGLRRTGSK